ncbi:hypothetical protein M0R45_027362 [Rubus argutus]|uniref:B-like cyclin n=1 Tax=Rubus argutus TaxID=59490 RepID=A0AAW1X0D5_RUBAR
MAPSFDSAVSSLLCAEDNIFDDNDFGSEEITWNHHRNRRNHNQNRDLGDDEEDGLPLQSSDEYLASIVENESHHLPRLDYLKRLQSGDLDLEARNEAVDWIRKANAHFSFGPLCQYLSVNYLDRFLSAYEIRNGKAWTMQLLAVACLLLAAKMEEIDVPLSLDLQVAESKYVFEARTIQRMELLVLSTLRWRMQAVTPFSFIDSFLLKINDDQIPLKASILRSVQLILSTTKGIDFLEYRALRDLEKDRVLKCVNLVQEVGLMSGAFKNNGSGSVQSVPQSPSGVLDVTCFSYKSDDHTTVGSCANSFHNGSDTKRRKLNRSYEVEL